MNTLLESQNVKSWTFLVCILLASLFLHEGPNDAVANPLVLIEEVSGGIFPENSTDLQMIQADVIMDINERFEEEGDFFIDFSGSYTIYNPNNTCEVQIAAPFYSYYTKIVDTLTIKIGETDIEYEIIFLDFNEINDIWSDYFFVPLSGRYFFLSRVNFTGFSNTTIHYSFQSEVRKNRITDGEKIYDGLRLVYDVGTARAWNGNTTERIEFRVHGERPYHIYNLSKPIVTDFESGTNYIWRWNNEFITHHFVFIEYRYLPNGIYPTSTSGFDKISFVSGLLITMILYAIKKKRILSFKN